MVGFALFAIQVSRAHMTFPGSIDSGAWVCFPGGVVALIGGFFGTRMVRMAPAATGPTVVEWPGTKHRFTDARLC